MGINDQGHLIISFVDGNVIDAGYVRGPQGIPGPSGQNAPQIDDTQASADHPWSGQKVRQELDALTAADVGARPDTWMPDGLIYETTAQTLEAMSQEQQAAMYAQGYRAIVATYNDTVTMHALTEDGSIAWIGCNQDTTNLLDNPDFAIAQAGYGGTHGVQVYAADRWAQSDGSATYSQASGGGLSIQMSQAGHIYQKLAKTLSGNFTLAVNVGGEDYISAGTWPVDSGDVGIDVGFPCGNIYADAMFGVVIYFTSSCTIAHARLLRGSYTSKTLPPWKNPDLSIELLKCMAYYQTIKSFYLSGNNTSVRLSPPMKSTPTVTGSAQEYVSGSGWIDTQNVTFSASNNSTIRLYASNASSATYAVTLELNADL